MLFNRIFSMQRCCCFKNLQHGSFAASIYTLIMYTFILTAGAFHLHEVVNDTDLLIFTLTLVIFSILIIIASILLIIGVCSENNSLLIPWIVTVFISTSYEFILSIYLVCVKELDPLKAAMFVIDFFICFLNLYCFSCVLSQYLKLRRAANEKCELCLTSRNMCRHFVGKQSDCHANPLRIEVITPVCSSTQPNDDWHELSGDAPILDVDEDEQHQHCNKTNDNNNRKNNNNNSHVDDNCVLSYKSNKNQQRKTSNESCHLLEVRPLQRENSDRRISADLSSGRTEQSFLAYI